MPIRDIVITIILLGALPFILRRPWVGGLMWIWVSVMSPHRLTWGFAYDLPFAQLIAVATILGILMTSREPRQMPWTPVTVVLLLLPIQMTISLIFAFTFDGSMTVWVPTMKTFLMLFVAFYVLHTKDHIKWVMIILTASIAFYGVKGGLFTLRGTGAEKVFGPARSYISENNALAVAVVMTIPLLRYWQLQVKQAWIKLGLLGAMVLCGVSALGSQSRGGLLAIAAMLIFLWLKGRNKVMTAIVLAVFVPLVVTSMPEKWSSRMESIANYEEDKSAMGRIGAWKMAINLANDRPFTGGGFAIYGEWIYAMYAPAETSRSAHSIWFQYLGEHGWVGFILYVLLWILVWRNLSWIIKRCRSRKDWQWAVDLSRMLQVSLVGFFVGGAFLQLAYWDVPFYMILVVVLTRLLVEKELGTSEARYPSRQERKLGEPGDQPAVSRVPLKPPLPAERR